MKNYDIRVVRLVKSTRTNPIPNYLTGENNIWICLGHFDIAIIDELPVKKGWTPLQAVQEDSLHLWDFNSSEINHKTTYTNAIENNYIYPLYAIKQFEEGFKEGQTSISGSSSEINENTDSEDIDQAIESVNFWDIQTNFLVVTRLHCEREAGAKSDISFPKMLLNRLKESYTYTENKVADFLQLSVSVKSQSTNDNLCAYISFYDSLELGDVIGFIKCNSLSAILQIQRTLYEAPCVSDAYTYCGINNKIFISNAEPLECDLLHNVSLEYVSTRFSVKHANYAEMVYPVLLGEGYESSSQHFFVVGNADIIIDWRNCSEWNLIEQLKKIVWLDNLVVSPNKCEKLMYHAFYDVITRIGLKHCPPHHARPLTFKKSPNLQKIFCPASLKEKLSSSQFNVRWRYPLVKLLGTLQTMSENSVMDDLSSLLIPGVNALLKRIDYYLNTQKPIDVTLLLSFLDRCTSLINDILHLENQLVQHPELMPVRYFIPAIVLGFEQKFISECAYLIENLDDEQRNAANHIRRFQPIIFPSCETNTSTLCYFDHKLDNDYTGDTPLAIYVPISQLYQPWMVLHTLCHEVAHYCGNILRDRSFRYNCIINSSAEFIIQLWDIFYGFEYSETKKSVVNNTRLKLANSISAKYQTVITNGNLYLDILKEALPMRVAEAAASRELQEEYLYRFLECSSEEEQLGTVAKFDTINSMYGGISLHEIYAKHLKKCIISHYKECYADVLMILFLDCSFIDYYDCVYSQECMRFLELESISPPMDNKAMWEYHTDRLALVALTISKIKGYETWLSGSSNIIGHPEGKWADIAVNKVQKWVERDRNNPKWHREYLDKVNYNPYKLYAYEVEQLLLYLSGCAQKLATRVCHEKDILKLRNLLERLSTMQFDWSSIRDYLENSSK